VSVRSLRRHLDRLEAGHALRCRTFLVPEGTDPATIEPCGPNCRCVAVVIEEVVIESPAAECDP
jgi:hypothetical protein